MGRRAPLAWDGRVLTGGLGHERGQRAQVRQSHVCSRGHRTDPAPGGHAFRWGFLGGRPGGGGGGGGVGMSEALAPRPRLPRWLLPELLSAKLPAPTALKSPLQFLPPSLGCAGGR